MIHIDTIHTLRQSLRAARRQLGLTQAQLALAAGVGLRFIVELEAGKPTLRLEHVLRVINALGGELSLGGLPSASSDPVAARPLSVADQPASHAERHQHQALDELVVQAQALKMGYE
jgi:HTH-type transcriptional regulator/antitoxin HipB